MYKEMGKPFRDGCKKMAVIGGAKMKLNVKRCHLVSVLVLILVLGIHANAWARFTYVWHVPKPMASVSAAMATVNECKDFLAVHADYSIREMSVDQYGLKIVAVPNNAQYRNEMQVALSFNQLTRFSLMTDVTEPGLYSSLHCEPGGSSIWVYDPTRGVKLIDALATLALAQKAALVPHYYFEIATGSEGYLQKVLNKAKVATGAVVHSADPRNSPLMDEDVIVQVRYGEKVVPIANKASWDTACLEAVAGKAETTVIAKVLRNGAALDKEIRVTNYGFDVNIEQSTSPAQPKSSLKFGAMLQAVDAEDIKRLGLPDAKGFLVMGILKGSVADSLQIRPEDVLLALNGMEITSVSQIQEMTSKEEIISAKVLRAGEILILKRPFVI